MVKSSLTGVAVVPIAIAALFAVAVPGHAQTDIPPAYVAVLDGDVTLVREGQTTNAILNMPIVAGDRLATGAGRVEVLFPDGSALDLDEGATADFISGGTDARIRLSSGRAILVVPAGTNAGRYEIATPSAVVVTRGPGKYRADAAGATVRNDGFEGWSDALRAARTLPAASPSAEHLPEELQPYNSTLDQNGTWQYAPTYGYVWYPRVESDWRPYYEGSWTTVPTYGWTWVGVNRWEYPTHHYGRWGYANNRWFWIPGRAYAPAWVAWGYASDYVSWCPLGVDSRPVFAMTMGYGNPWTGWTVVSKSHFGGRGYVPRFAVAPNQLPGQTPFVVQHAAPSAVPRAGMSSVPSSGGVGVAIPRAPTAGTPTPYTPAPQRRSPPDMYRPAYAPPQTTPPAPAQAANPPPAQPQPSAAPRAGRENQPASATPAARSAPATGGAGGTAPRATTPAPSSTPPPAPSPSGSAPHAGGSGAAAPAQKPADSGKAKPTGRGGL